MAIANKRLLQQLNPQLGDMIAAFTTPGQKPEVNSDALNALYKKLCKQINAPKTTYSEFQLLLLDLAERAVRAADRLRATLENRVNNASTQTTYLYHGQYADRDAADEGNNLSRQMNLLETACTDLGTMLNQVVQVMESDPAGSCTGDGATLFTSRLTRTHRMLQTEAKACNATEAMVKPFAPRLLTIEELRNAIAP